MKATGRLGPTTGKLGVPAYPESAPGVRVEVWLPESLPRRLLSEPHRESASPSSKGGKANPSSLGSGPSLLSLRTTLLRKAASGRA